MWWWDPLKIQIIHYRINRPWDYPENFWIYTPGFLNLVFYLPQCAFSWIKRDKILISQFSRPKFRYFADQNVPKGGTPWKRILIIFKCKNKLPKKLGFEKEMKKMGSFVWFSCLIPELWPFNCQKLCPFSNFLLISAKI